MARWSEVEAGAPELAAKIRARFERDVVAIMASLRRDGSPRISGIETTFGGGELWLGMMPGSLKARDLLRDPRVALHCATIDKDGKDGDAKISGRAIDASEEDTLARFRRILGDERPIPPGSFHLFTVDVAEISFLKPAGDHLDIEWWSEDGGYRSVDRY